MDMVIYGIQFETKNKEVQLRMNWTTTNTEFTVLL